MYGVCSRHWRSVLFSYARYAGNQQCSGRHGAPDAAGIFLCSVREKRDLDEAEKTEQQIAELEERLRTIRAAQKKEEDSEIIRAIRSTKMGGRELLALLDNIQAGNVTFLTAVNNASEEAETEKAIEKDA